MAGREDDARFLKSEKLMIEAATEEIKSGSPITVTKLCRRAGVFTSTFYRHYRSLNELIKTQEKNLLKDFNELIKAASRGALSMELFFKRWAHFIYQNRDAFHLSILANQINILLLMMQQFRPVATTGWRSSPQKANKIYLIYSYEVISVWVNWVEQEHFDVDKISGHVQELNYLTHTALQRLGGLKSN